MSGFFREAIRHHKPVDPEWAATLRETSAIGNELGIASEEDVERMSDKWWLAPQR